MKRSRTALFALTIGFVSMNPGGAGAAQPGSDPSLVGLTSARLYETEFFRFFNLEHQTTIPLDDGRGMSLYRPSGSFNSQVLLAATERGDDGVDGLTLTVHRSFVDDGVTGLFARDLVGSFLAAAAPSSDADFAQSLADLIKHQAGSMVEAVMGADDPASRALSVVQGSSIEATLEMTAAALTLSNGPDINGVPSLIVRIRSLLAANERRETEGLSPEEVVNSIFDAAKKNDASLLAGLCDPEGENDEDTATLCSLTKAEDMWVEFVEQFKDGRVTGPAVIEANFAQVPFVFGPGGGDSESMELVRRDGNWYLMAF